MFMLDAAICDSSVLARCVSRLDLAMPVLDPLHLDSLLSLQSCSRMGLLLPVCGVSGMGPVPVFVGCSAFRPVHFLEKRRLDGFSFVNPGPLALGIFAFATQLR